MPFKDNATTSSANSERESAIRESRDCAFCSGQGQATVYHSRHDGSGSIVIDGGRRIPTVVAAHCRCSYGNWIRKSNSEETQRRTPWVEDIARGRSRWLLQDPTTDDDMDYPDRPVDAQSFVALKQRIARLQKRIPFNPVRTTAAEIARDLATRAREVAR